MAVERRRMVHERSSNPLKARHRRARLPNRVGKDVRVKSSTLRGRKQPDTLRGTVGQRDNWNQVADPTRFKLSQKLSHCSAGGTVSGGHAQQSDPPRHRAAPTSLISACRSASVLAVSRRDGCLLERVLGSAPKGYQCADSDDALSYMIRRYVASQK
jgi:hypothetical protein